MIVSLIAWIVEAYIPYWLSLLMTAVTRMNPLQTAIASSRFTLNGQVNKWSWMFD